MNCRHLVLPLVVLSALSSHAGCADNAVGVHFSRLESDSKPGQHDTAPVRLRSNVDNLIGIDQVVAAFEADAARGTIRINFGKKNIPLLHYDNVDLTQPANAVPEVDPNLRTVDPANIHGTIYLGPYPFLADQVRYADKQFADVRGKISKGQGEVPLEKLLTPTTNSEHWNDRGTVVVRLELYATDAEPSGQGTAAGEDLALGVYDTFLSFKYSKRADSEKLATEDAPAYEFTVLPTIVEGPMVNLLHSGGRPVISFVTAHNGSGDVEARVRIMGRKPIVRRGAEHPFFSEANRWLRYEVPLPGLEPNTEYRYAVEAGGIRTSWHRFKTAPPPGSADRVRFVFIGDSRGSVGDVEKYLMGVNHTAMQRLARLAYNLDAQFMLMGGDLCSGYTTSKTDLRTQLYSWKQAVAGFASERPIYATMGNHEALLTSFNVDGSQYGVGVDRWPYETESAEAVFAEEFVHPALRCPEPEEPGLPTYSENAYTFQYGCVGVIAFNTNYWTLADTRKVDGVTTMNRSADRYGGCPEGYVMKKQLRWIEQRIDAAEADPKVRYLILFGHEPMFPNGKHLRDAMWYGGDNGVKSHAFKQNGGQYDEMERGNKGIIEVRNRLARKIAASAKVAAVIASDEHAYYRTLIGPAVPVGDPDVDAVDNKLVWPGPLSPLSDLKRRTWYLVCGGGGAPYSGELPSPWNQFWKSRSAGDIGYRHSPQQHLLFFEADEAKISLRVVNVHGETIDGVDNLMSRRELAPKSQATGEKSGKGDK